MNAGSLAAIEKASPITVAHRALPLLYAAWAFPILTVMCWVMPPWQNADEDAHFVRAEQIAHGHIIGDRAGIGAGSTSDGGIYQASSVLNYLPHHSEYRLSSRALIASGSIGWGSRVFVANPNTVIYPPAFYIPQALAIRLVQGLSLSINQTLRLARLANALTALTVTVMAIALARRAKAFLLIIAMLPMSLSLFASSSQDALLIASCLLSVAVVDRIIEEHRDATSAERMIVIFLLALIIMAKPPYVALALMALLLSARLNLSGIRSTALIVVPAVVWTLIMVMHVSVSIHSNSPVEQAHYVVAYPVQTALAILRTYWFGSRIFSAELIGYLGWLDDPVDPVFSSLGQDIIGLSLLCCLGGRSRKPALIVGVLLCSLVGVALAEYLDWTPTGLRSVEGLQGRYFLPLLAACSLAVPTFSSLSRLTKPAALVGPALLACFVPVIMAEAVVFRYYLV